MIFHSQLRDDTITVVSPLSGQTCIKNMSSSESANAQSISFERTTRIDHRTADQFRPLKCEQGLLKQADGSARFMQGHTSVMVAVYGPMECARTNQERIDGSFVEVLFNAAVDDDTQQNKERSEILRRIFEPVILRSLHPRTLLRIVVQVIKDDGSVLAAATNGVCMALMDAGFPMKSFAVGVSCLASSTALTVDPTLAEEQSGGVSGAITHAVVAERLRLTLMSCGVHC